MARPHTEFQRQNPSINAALIYLDGTLGELAQTSFAMTQALTDKFLTLSFDQYCGLAILTLPMLTTLCFLPLLLLVDSNRSDPSKSFVGLSLVATGTFITTTTTAIGTFVANGGLITFCNDFAGIIGGLLHSVSSFPTMRLMLCVIAIYNWSETKSVASTLFTPMSDALRAVFAIVSTPSIIISYLFVAIILQGWSHLQSALTQGAMKSTKLGSSMTPPMSSPSSSPPLATISSGATSPPL